VCSSNIADTTYAIKVTLATILITNFRTLTFSLISEDPWPCLKNCGQPKHSNDQNYFTLSHHAAFGDFHSRTTGSHVALCKVNSGAESGRELFKGSKDMASLLFCNQKKNFLVGVVDFL